MLQTFCALIKRYWAGIGMVWAVKHTIETATGQCVGFDVGFGANGASLSKLVVPLRSLFG